MSFAINASSTSNGGYAIMDKISIADLQIFSHHGVFEEEKKLGQWFCVSADLFLNTNESSKTDNLANTVNYSSVCDSIAAFLVL